MRWARSLQTQLVLRLAAVLLIAAGAGVAALLHESSQAADALRREELLQRAQELGRLAERGADGALRVSLSPGLEQLFQTPGGSDLFVIRSESGEILATSRPEFAAYMGSWPPGGTEPRYVRVKRFGPAGQEFCALTLRTASPVGSLSVTVARALDDDALAHTVLNEFVR